MSKPKRISCQDLESIPTTNDLRNLLSVGVYLVLEFPRSIDSCDLQPIINELSIQLPDHSIFYSGTFEDSVCLTIRKVIAEQIVLDNAALFLQSIQNYLELSDELIHKLANNYGVSPDFVISNYADYLEKSDDNYILEGNWGYHPHGESCYFWNLNTGQTIDMIFDDYGIKDAIPDPDYLHEYIKTTDSEAEVSTLLKDDYHNTCRMLKILKENGYLKGKLPFR